MRPSSDEFFELSVINHLLDDVEATDELPLDNKLRECWPVIVGLKS